MNKLDITSTAIEKSIDLVKGFLEKISGAAIEETGLLIADNIRLRRFKNQLTIFANAQKIAEEKGFDTKKLSLKTLVPLIEYSSLEDDETLQEKWTNLIVNYVDSKKTLESSILPYILNQISSKELVALEEILDKPFIRFANLELTGVEISNMLRLGIIDVYDDGITYFHDEGYKPDKRRMRYSITDLGKEMVICCKI